MRDWKVQLQQIKEQIMSDDDIPVPTDTKRDNDDTGREGKKLKVDIFAKSIESNAHIILATFRKQARREGWTGAEISLVMAEAMKGSYDDLIQTIMRHTE